ncbi:MAG: glycosyltransferase family 39 protein [Chloroflexi bacterium]|nr:glycosyltransferase family 39 protein [Chloroflexota bacterium]
MRLRHFALPTFILLSATLLRLHHLDFRALWWDEGLSLFFARMSYANNAQMAATLADTNPPVYRILLGVWLNLVGWSAFTARLFSVLPGVVLVAIVYRLARKLKFPRETALVAMALCAASPILIYYSQEAKGYSLVAMAGTASVLLWLNLHPRPPAPPPRRQFIWWLAWSLMLLLLVGAHYIAAFLLVVENLWTAALTLRSWRGNKRHWLQHWTSQIGAQALVAAALLPFVILTFGGTSAVIRGETGDFIGLNGPAQFFGQHLLELTQGPTASGGWAWVTAGVVVGLAVIGYWLLDASHGRFAWDLGFGFWGLLSWILLPILFGFALNSYHQFFFPRFVLYTVPAILILVASGISHIANRLSRVVRLSPPALLIVNCALCIALWSPTLNAHYTAPGDPAEDWRPLASTLRPLVHAGDAAIYTWGWIPGYLDAYLPHSPRPNYTLGFFTPQSLDPEMNVIASGEGRVWLLDYQVDQFDVRNMAGRWLGERAALVYDQWIGLGHVALFVLEPMPASGDPIEFEFANGLRLTTQQVNAELAPGDALAIRLTWTAANAISDRATIFLHGLAADGSLAFGRDSEPDNGLSFVTDWQAGQTYTELRGLLIPPDLPAGTYTLQIGLYNTLTGAAGERGPATIGAVVVK